MPIKYIIVVTKLLDKIKYLNRCITHILCPIQKYIKNILLLFMIFHLEEY